MAMGRMKPQHGELLVPVSEIGVPGHPFYERLKRLLSGRDFDRRIEALCESYYADHLGRPLNPLRVYFRILMIGYFKGIDSKRGMAWMCQDSLALKSFPGFQIAKQTPHHGALCIILQRLSHEIYEAVLGIVLGTLAKGALINGRKISINSSIMADNAAMRAIVGRDTGERCGQYGARLAAEAREPAETQEEQARLDRDLKKRTSNEHRVSKADPDFRVARIKDGRTRLAHNPEHRVDMDSDATFAATMKPANCFDHETSFNTLTGTTANVDSIDVDTKAATIVADKVYRAETVIAGCTSAELNTCIAVPASPRGLNWKGKISHAGKSIESNRRRAWSEHRNKLLRKRGETVGRSFAHPHASGDMRRTHPRGTVGREKRYLVPACVYDLVLVMRMLFRYAAPEGLSGVFPKLWRAIFAVVYALRALMRPYPRRQPAEGPREARAPVLWRNSQRGWPDSKRLLLNGLLDRAHGHMFAVQLFSGLAPPARVNSRSTDTAIEARPEAVH